MMAPLQAGDPRQVAAYRILSRLAVGGMGIVYLGESPGGRLVAVKLIRPELAGDPEFRARFRHEVEAARLIGGYHTAAVVHADFDAEPPWMVTQYVPGPSLDAKVTRDGPLDPAGVHRLAAALAEGLRAIHAHGLVHRDLKPLNIIMADDGPRIIDFGIAKATGASSDPRLTATGMVVGTPAFLSPEQLDGSPVGPATDIFSLGSVLVFAATGRTPFERRNFTATSYAIVNQPPDLHLVAAPFAHVLAACLDKDPGRRPTADELLTQLTADRSSSFSRADPRGVDDVAEAIAPVAADVAAQGHSVAPGPGAVPLAPARRPAVRAAIRRRALERAAPAPRVSLARAEEAAAVPPRHAAAPVQVRPASAGWRLVAAGADGRWLASANGDGIITVWLAESGLPVRSWSAGARVRAMAAGPGDLLVAVTDDGRAGAWNVAAGTALPYLPAALPGLAERGVRVRVRSLALDPSGTWLAAGTEGRLLLWDVADPGEPLLAAWLPCPAEVTALAFDGTARHLAVGDEAGSVHVWSLAELAAAVPVSAAPGSPASLETAWVDPPGTLPGLARPRPGPVLALARDDTGERWLSVRTAGTQGWLDGVAAEGSAVTEGVAAKDPVLADMPLRAAALGLAGGFAALIDDRKGRMHLASLQDFSSPRPLNGSDLIVTGVAFTGSATLAIGASDGSVRLWQMSRQAMGVLSTTGSPVTAVSATISGTRLAVSNRRSELRSFAAVNGSLKPGWTVDAPEAGDCLVFLPDEERLATAGDAVQIWNAADGTRTAILPGRTGRVRAITADHDGRRIAAAWAEAVVTVYEGNRLLWELTGHQGAVLTVAFGPRPGLLVSAGDDETIRTWDLAAGKETDCQSPPGYRATVLAASPSGTMLAAGCADGTVLLYEAGGPGPLPDWADALTLTGHGHGITALSFDISGRFLATGSRDGTARIWDLAARSAVTVLLPGAAAVMSSAGTWHGLGETTGLIWQASGLARVPLPLLEAAL